MYKVGAPYQINGVWYYPAVDYNYDETGVASWYGEQFDQRYTANGEIFDLNELTAAHRTLPMPSIIQVTNLSNGRALQLRVDGPQSRRLLGGEVEEVRLLDGGRGVLREEREELDGVAIQRAPVIDGEHAQQLVADHHREAGEQRGETGQVVSGRDPHAVAAALVELLADPDRAAVMGAAGRDWMRRDWRWSTSAARLAGFLGAGPGPAYTPAPSLL